MTPTRHGNRRSTVSLGDEGRLDGFAIATTVPTAAGEVDMIEARQLIEGGAAHAQVRRFFSQPPRICTFLLACTAERADWSAGPTTDSDYWYGRAVTLNQTTFYSHTCRAGRVDWSAGHTTDSDYRPAPTDGCLESGGERCTNSVLFAVWRVRPACCFIHYYCFRVASHGPVDTGAYIDGALS